MGMRLTSDLIQAAPSYVNTLKGRELDLRGNKIPFIENLGATQDQYDVIDLTDNEISKLENFPLLKQLNTLILHNNRINRIEENLGSYLPKLEWLMLNNNRVSEFSDIEAL